jgi:DNA-directed RNA polymerase specialized sigma24 family protein
VSQGVNSEEISVLLQRVKDGRDDAASAALWEQYFGRLLKVARHNMASLPKRASDEEDVALSAMNSFFRAAEEGRLSNLQNRDELWKILVTMVIRKANRTREKLLAQKRGGGDVRGESFFLNASDASSPGLAGVPDEELVTGLMRQCREMIDLLDDPLMKEIAVMIMEGCSIDEIAVAKGVSRSTIKRKKELIRQMWEQNMMD